MESEKLYFEAGPLRKIGGSASEAEKLPGEGRVLTEFSLTGKPASSSKRSRHQAGRHNVGSMNERGNGDKNRQFNDELWDRLVESWCAAFPVNLRSLIYDVEKSVIIKILGKVSGNQRIAAKILGISPTTLNEKLKKYGIHFRKAPFIE